MIFTNVIIYNKITYKKVLWNSYHECSLIIMSKLDVSLKLFRIPSNSSCYVLVHVGISSDIFCLVFCPSWVWLITVLQCNARWAREARHWNRNNFDLPAASQPSEYLGLNWVKHKVRFIKYPEFFLINLKMSCMFLMLRVIPVLRLRYQDKIFSTFLTPADYSKYKNRTIFFSSITMYYSQNKIDSPRTKLGFYALVIN